MAIVLNGSNSTVVRLAAVALAFALMPACGSASREGSQSTVTWGHSPDSSNFLIHVPNGSTINLCGSDLPNVAWAIQTWAAAIGFTYSYAESCDSTKAQVFSYGTGDTGKTDDCTAHGKNGGFSRPTLMPQEIIDCGSWNSGQKFLLHETGHLFGMCDQYDTYSTDKSYCTNTVNIDTDSVMAAANRTDLSQDDLDGIQALYRQVYGR